MVLESYNFWIDLLHESIVSSVWSSQGGEEFEILQKITCIRRVEILATEVHICLYFLNNNY